jgi:hypothetical protein
MRQRLYQWGNAGIRNASTHRPTLKFETGILVLTTRTFRQFGPNRARIKLVAADAVKRRFPTLPFERPVIPPIIPKPECQEYDGDERTINDSSDG